MLGVIIMAVTLPSDLILDVMRGADPGRLKMAVAKLGEIPEMPATKEVDFAKVMRGMSGKSAASQPEDLITGVLNAAGMDTKMASETHFALLFSAAPRPAVSLSTKTETGEPYKAFERMVLRNMFESMLPSEQSGIYGGDSSGGIWRSLSADQLAGVYADRGGIGIAQSLSQSPAKSDMTPQDQWPYFETDRIRSFTG
jgi:hypothetical protein